MEFSQIRKKGIKDLLIKLYVIEHFPEYSPDQLQSMVSMIMICFHFKILSAKDVIMKEWKIHEILNLDKLDRQSIVVKTKKTTTSSSKKKISSLWEKSAELLALQKEKYKLNTSHTHFIRMTPLSNDPEEDVTSD